MDAVSADASTLVVAADTREDTAVLMPRGRLDSSTYRSLRDEIIKAALDRPRAVIVDVSKLFVPAESAWAVFTSARWHVGTWPEVPIMLVCDHDEGRSAIKRNGITRYVPLYPAVADAAAALSSNTAPRARRRARADLPRASSSLRRSRELVSEWLTAWSQSDFIPVAKVVVTTLAENVLEHTESRLGIRVEFDGSNVTIAVEDACRNPATLHETPLLNRAPSGLRIVSALCRTWGNAPTPNGKTVWAVIGPENRL